MSFLAGIFGALWARIFAGLAALFLLGFMTQTIRIEGWWFIVGFKEENAILRMDLTKMQVAQSIAAAAASAAKERDEATYSRLAERADDEVEKSTMRNAAARYARANRVRTKTPDRAPSGASTPGPAGDTQGVVGAGETTGVVVSQTDFDILVENTLRLKVAQGWAKGLVDAGLAVEGD